MGGHMIWAGIAIGSTIRTCLLAGGPSYCCVVIHARLECQCGLVKLWKGKFWVAAASCTLPYGRVCPRGTEVRLSASSWWSLETVLFTQWRVTLAKAHRHKGVS